MEKIIVLLLGESEEGKTIEKRIMCSKYFQLLNEVNINTLRKVFQVNGGIFFNIFCTGRSVG